MSHLHRFFIEPGTAENNLAPLHGAEAHHALHVARVRLGDEVALFDGAGREFAGKLVSATRNDAVVEISDEKLLPREHSRLTLVQAALHKEKAVEDLVRRCTEIGVSKFLFYRAERSERAPKLSDKLRRRAIESCKQCKRPWLPEFEIEEDLSVIVSRNWTSLLVAAVDLPPTPLRDAVRGDNIGIIVGPEGDFTPPELDMMTKGGAVPVSLGPAVYRSEVASVLSCALIRYEEGFMGP